MIIEIDGGQHAEELNQIKDARRTAFLESKGFRVIRFWSNEVLSDTDVVLQSLMGAPSL